MKKEESGYGKGFVIRMFLLVGVLAMIVGGYYYDKLVLVPGADERVTAVLKIQEFANKKTKDADRISKNDVREMIGNWASRTTREYTTSAPKKFHNDEEFMANFVPTTFEIESYKFKRIVPGLESQLVEIAYLNDVAMFSQTGNPIAEGQLDWGFDESIEDQGGSDNSSEF